MDQRPDPERRPGDVQTVRHRFPPPARFGGDAGMAAPGRGEDGDAQRRQRPGARPRPREYPEGIGDERADDGGDGARPAAERCPPGLGVERRSRPGASPGG
ncbi:hypothetical protein [Sphaerobacter thermophilus]|uniref:hypothetical protein n=1 Tax=Sphaerobacter thermophilus TaxID=2057 RepID=UPI0039C1C71A